MLHRTARLTPYGRQLLVERILIEGWPAATAAETLGVSRATAYKWLRRYAAEGPAGLDVRSARPQHQPRALPERQVRRSSGRRRARRPASPGAAPGSSPLDRVRRAAPARSESPGPRRSTDWPARALCPGAGRRAHPHRCQEARPGAAWRRPPDPRYGGPQPPRARPRLPPCRDRRCDAGGVRRVHPDERAATTVRFVADALAFFAGQGVQVERVMTDNALTYTHSKDWPSCSPSAASATSGSVPIGRRPTAKPSGSSARSSANRRIAAIPLKRRATRVAAALARHLQSPTSPRRTQGPDPDVGPCQQGRRERQLGRLPLPPAPRPRNDSGGLHGLRAEAAGRGAVSGVLVGPTARLHR